MAQVVVVVGSKNPVKIESVKKGFLAIFPEFADKLVVEGENVPSGVSDQPMSGEETLKGARNRAHGCQKKRPEANFWFGVEGGLEDAPHSPSSLSAFAFIVCLFRDEEGVREGVSRTGTFTLPEEVGKLVRGGMELGEADDVVFKQSNSKQKNGAVGILTNNTLTRATYYEQAVVLSLIPAKNPSLYPPTK
uniref:inosine/xanthosine triphosphatase n=1 Tax=Paramoeba aestuarina TaxID=180227 RepID=A0A7S4NVW0_9EUKA|mmetsp:Transcript_30426/g.47248  ORF Transcript_30426/g.47248 Transcript_30426/m.47248 type:complete len:191 (+) Transcript_30426:94-666(+)